MGDFTLGLDFLAAIVTLLYVSKLLLGELISRWSVDQVFDSPWSNGFEKRSLLNQHVNKRQFAK